MAKEQLTPEEYEILFGEPPPEPDPPDVVIDLSAETTQPLQPLQPVDNSPRVPFSFNDAEDIPQRFSLNDPNPETPLTSISNKRRPPALNTDAPYSELPYVRDPITVTFNTDANQEPIAAEVGGNSSISGEPWKPNKYMLVAVGIVGLLIAAGTLIDLPGNPVEDEIEVEVLSEVEERPLDE